MDRRKKKFWLWGWGFGNGLLVSVLVASGQALDGESVVDIMPRGFEEVQLGMTADQLQELRPKVKVFDIFSEPEEIAVESIDLYVEFLTENQFFDVVDFTFVGDYLCLVKWSLIRQPENFSVIRSAIISGAVRKWGDEFERVVLNQGGGSGIQGMPPEEPVDKGINVPGLRWETGGVEILVDYTPSEATSVAPALGDQAKPPPKLIRVSIYGRSCLSPKLADSMKEIELAPDELARSLFKDLETKDSGIFFE